MAPIRVQSLEYPASMNPKMKTNTPRCKYVLNHLASATVVSRERGPESLEVLETSSSEDAFSSIVRFGVGNTHSREVDVTVDEDRFGRPETTLRDVKGCRALRTRDEACGARGCLTTRDPTADTGAPNT